MVDNLGYPATEAARGRWEGSKMQAVAGIAISACVRSEGRFRDRVQACRRGQENGRGQGAVTRECQVDGRLAAFLRLHLDTINTS